MKGKIGGVLLCLLFALPFGGVGVFATYSIYKSIHDGVRAKDWVRVKAEVLANEDTYRYSFKGQSYTSTRLGTMPFAGTSDVDDFDEQVGSLFAQAREEKRPITVYVNPDNPAESMVDRRIRWLLMLFFVPFALAFGGVGVGALVAAVVILRKPDSKKQRRGGEAAEAAAQASSGLGMLWVFAFFWNVIAFPIAALALPDIIQRREWIGLFVLLFPLIGLGLLYAALKSTFDRLRRGRAEIQVQSREARVGGAVEGYVTFPRGVRSGEPFVMRLVCMRHFDNGEDVTVSPHWNRLVEAKATDVGQGVRVPFRLEIPPGSPPTSEQGEQRVWHRWYVEVSPAGTGEALKDREEIEVLPALPGMAAAEAPPAPAAQLDPALEKLLGGMAGAEGKFTPEQRAALAQLSSDQQAAVAKVVRLAPHAKKVIIAVVGLLIVWELAPLVLSLIGNP